MNEATESPRELIEAYAKALRDLSQASTEEEISDATIDMNEVCQEMEERSAEVAEALHELLEPGTQRCNSKQK